MTIAAFVEVRLETGLIIFNTSGGPGASTSIATSLGGAEFRNVNQASMLGKWQYGERNMMPADFENLNIFFHARRGKAQGFRYKDWGNYKDNGTGSFSVIDSTHSQMIKTFSDAYRIIRKPVYPIIVVGTGVYSIDYVTGIVTTISGAAPTSWTGEFDTPVRFDVDDIKFEFIAATTDAPGGEHNISGAYFYIHSFPIVELRNP